MFKKLISFLVATILFCDPVFAGVAIQQIGGTNLTTQSGTAKSMAFNTAPFYAPLSTSLTLVRGTGSPTFTRASTATVPQYDGSLQTALANEARFYGMRRVQNLLTYSEDYSNPVWSKSATATVTLGVADPKGGIKACTITAGAVNDTIVNAQYSAPLGEVKTNQMWIRRRSGVGTIQMINADFTAWNVVLPTAVWTKFSQPVGGTGTASVTGIMIGTIGDQIDIAFAQVNLGVLPAEYVSANVLAAPYHGAGVDGVQYFQTYNGNTVTSNVITEAQGAPLPRAGMGNYLSEGAATNYFLNSGAPVTQTTGSLATGTYTAWITGTGTLTISAGTATITGGGAASAGTPVTFVVTVAGTVVCTVAGGPTTAQVENSPFQTSSIPTAGATVTRAADLLLYPSSGNVSAAAGTVYAEATSSNKTNVYTSFVSSYNLFGSGLAYTDFTNRLAFYDEGSLLERTFGLTFIQPTGVATKVATKWGGASTNGALNGVLGTASGFSGNAIMGTSLGIGDDVGGGANVNGLIGNVRIWQTQLPDATLRAITTP